MTTPVMTTHVMTTPVMSTPVMSTPPMNHIYIDASYFIFYRVFALCVWWRNAKKDEPLIEPALNDEFLEKFCSTFVDKIKEIPKKLGLKKQPYKIFVARDCKQSDIWRKKLFPEYKHGRNQTKNKEANISAFFRIAYEQKLFENAGVELIYEHDHLEADDCIYLASKKHMEVEPHIKCFIIASDHDYLQLISDKVKLYDLKYKDVSTSKTAYTDAAKNLFSKIILGDKSDNIGPVFKNKKVGVKTMELYYDNRELFSNALNDCEGAKEAYNLNRQLIYMFMIPDDLQYSFYRKYN
jgi:5'-3' exonuclease